VTILTQRVAKLHLPGSRHLLCQLLLGSLLASPAAWSATPQPPPAVGGGAITSPDGTELPEVQVEAPEPKYVAPTLRDRIGRIWAPVLINGKGPFRMVLDTGASHSAIIARVADNLGVSAQNDPILVRGVTGAAVVPAIRVDRMEVGDLLIEPSTLPIVADVFGGAEGVLGREGLPDKRIYADFRADRLVISRSHRERAGIGFNVVPLNVSHGGLLSTEIRVGSIRAQAIIDTGGQQTVGNLALREALMKHPPKDAVTEEIIGVTLDEARGDMIPAPPIQLGTMKLQHVHVAFTDAYLFEHLQLTKQPVLLLGMDVLGSFDVLVIDYKLREMQIRTRNASMSSHY
jgi:predicted aspartyl protease